MLGLFASYCGHHVAGYCGLLRLLRLLRAFAGCCALLRIIARGPLLRTDPEVGRARVCVGGRSNVHTAPRRVLLHLIASYCVLLRLIARWCDGPGCGGVGAGAAVSLSRRCYCLSPRRSAPHCAALRGIASYCVVLRRIAPCGGETGGSGAGGGTARGVGRRRRPQ